MDDGIFFKRLTKEDVELIEDNLRTTSSAAELARLVKFDASGLIKHIKKYRRLVEPKIANKCGKMGYCRKTMLCGGCRFKRHSYEKLCKSCKLNCNQLCAEFTKIPDCERLRRFPYVCNGCENARACHLGRLFYDSAQVWRAIQRARVDPRRGPHADEGEFLRLSDLLKPLIVGKHQSLPQVFLTHKAQIRWSYPTVLSYIDRGLIPGIKNIDLTKRVKYPSKYKKRGTELSNAAFLKGRTYDDFVEYCSSHMGSEVVEMDTVLSSREGSSCLLTLLFRKSNFMLAFKLESKTSANVAGLFRRLRSFLGNGLFSEAFGIILTDNGSEFADPLGIECDENGEVLSRLFYCDPGKSGQKGKIEKNHVELRKVFPKGTDFGSFSQKQINIALSHINSEPRAILNGNCPGAIQRSFLNKKIPATIEYHFIEADCVFLHPNLLK